MRASNGSEELVYLLAEGLLLFHLPQHLNLVNFNALGLDMLRTGNAKTLAAILLVLLHDQCRSMRACMSMGLLRFNSGHFVRCHVFASHLGWLSRQNASASPSEFAARILGQAKHRETSMQTANMQTLLPSSYN